jgi:uncharacterized membrane protein YphA (DoxX/SURF4 family)
MKKPIQTWTAIVAEPSFGYDLIRMYLGAALFVRGGIFLADPEKIFAYVRQSGGDWFWPAVVGHYVGIAHLCGGAMLALGVATRIAAIAQLPVLLGAVFLVHWHDGLLAQGQSLELAGIVLFLLAVYSVFGAGPLSVDQRLSTAQHGAIAEAIKRARARIRRRQLMETAEANVSA